MTEPLLIVDSPPTQREFVDSYLARSRPLVVRNGLQSWNMPPPWTFDSVLSMVGDQRAPIYDSLFTLTGLTTLRKYHARFVQNAEPGARPPYLRWFSRQSAERLPWADDAFLALANSWHAPEWIPTEGYTFPAGATAVDIARQSFPAKGIFVCGRGGMTRWHVDPWYSDAYLCQVIGHKRILLYPPETTTPADPEALFAVIDAPGMLPPRWPSSPLIDVVLAPGDCAYIPQQHPHAALAMSPSLSLTWNFVHSANDTGYRSLPSSDAAEDAALAYFSNIRA
ncbi:cupin-like domain-containing protein [Nocardia sp. NPDC059177]|uniref:cupin-like domain-containing protein n=1 Tax=Nocardia sp. NPDC059177 TaxID=3346759 RepID=UPI00367C326A